MNLQPLSLNLHHWCLSGTENSGPFLLQMLTLVRMNWISCGFNFGQETGLVLTFKLKILTRETTAQSPKTGSAFQEVLLIGTCIIPFCILSPALVIRL